MIEPKCKCGHIRSKHNPVKGKDGDIYWSGCWECVNQESDEFGFKNICMRWNDSHVAEEIEKLAEDLRSLYKKIALPVNEILDVRAMYAAVLSGKENEKRA